MTGGSTFLKETSNPPLKHVINEVNEIENTADQQLLMRIRKHRDPVTIM